MGIQSTVKVEKTFSKGITKSTTSHHPSYIIINCIGRQQIETGTQDMYHHENTAQ